MPDRLFSLDGRTTVVTGGSRGIGRAIAEGFVAAGARVLSLARNWRDADAPPPGLVPESCDLLDIDAFERVVKGFLGEAPMDVLVNAAGITIPGGTIDDFDRTVAVNLRAPYQTAMVAAALMQGSTCPSIINITSLGAWRGFPKNPAYVAAKGGLSQLSAALAYDLGGSGIRVNNLVPGYIRTDMTAASWNDPRARRARESHTMLGRWGRPEDLVGAAIFLASDASAYVTGQNIVVDGGWLAKGLVDSDE